MENIQLIFKGGINFIWNLRDKKTDGWLLVESFPLIVVICFCYIILVSYLGPKFMAGREPIVYRYQYAVIMFACAIMNIWLQYRFWISGWGTGYTPFCKRVDYTINSKSLQMAATCWWFYMSKYVDFIYTLINVLWKKFHKITAQHVIHHSTMVINCWLLVRFVPGGHITFICFLNTVVHTIMYSYLCLSFAYPTCPLRHLLAKVATTSSFVELLIVPTYQLLPLIFNCDYPRIISWFTVAFVTVYIVLFLITFYCKGEENEKIAHVMQYEILHQKCNGAVDTKQILDLI